LAQNRIAQGCWPPVQVSEPGNALPVQGKTAVPVPWQPPSKASFGPLRVPVQEPGVQIIETEQPVGR
jgi:hypothetical protein